MWMCHSVTHFCVFPLNFHLLFSEILKLQIYLKVKSVWKGLSIFKLVLHTHAYSYSHTYTIHLGMLSRVFVVNINMRDLWIFWAVQFECVSGEAWRWEGGRILVIGNTLVDDRVDGIWHFLHRNSGLQWHWHSLLFGHGTQCGMKNGRISSSLNIPVEWCPLYHRRNTHHYMNWTTIEDQWPVLS